MPDMLQEALHYAELGMAVFPLVPRDKTPATEHGFKDATTDPEKIRKWWHLQPDCNIGIATGEVSRLVVIDIDNDETTGKDGSGELRKWEKSNGDLPETWTVTTGRGGAHYYYRTTEDFRSKASIFPSIDVRGNGGYVVAPPSVHPNGQPYEWDGMYNPDDMAIAQVNDTVRRFLKGAQHKEQNEDIQQIQQKPIESGRRVNSLVSWIGALRNVGLDTDLITEKIRRVNETQCNPPLTEDELRKEVFPALTRNWLPGINPAEMQLRPPVDPSEFPPFENFKDIFNDPPPKKPVLIENVMRRGHKMIISGQSKAGKSFAALELAFAIAEGMKWFGHWCTKGKVLFVNMEVDGASLDDRLINVYKAFGKTTDGHMENITLWHLRGVEGVSLKTLTEELIRRTKEQNYSCIIIDPIYKIMTGDENSNGDMARMLTTLDRVAREAGASVVFVHHFSKGIAGDRSSIDRGSGAGVFARDPDAILTVTQLDQEPEVDAIHTAWRVEYNLREYPGAPPTNVWWEYPIHRVDYEGVLDTAELVTSESKKKRISAQNKETKAQEQQSTYQKDYEVIEAVITAISDEDGTFLYKDLLKRVNISDTTLRRRLDVLGYEPEKTKKGKSGKWRK